MNYQGPAPSTDQPECTGVLLTNLGTPDAPTTKDVRRYLKEFLSDPRVVETPQLIWWLVLNGIILRTRPSKSAEAYQKVWTDNGSPLLDISRRQAAALDARLKLKSAGPIKVALAMRYGNPSIADGLEALRRANARRVIVLPLYPQYSATTTASTFDAVSDVLKQWRWIPELQFITHYQDYSGYISSLENSVRNFWQEHGEPDRLLISFHGIPKDYADAGDPYPEECSTTAQLLADALGLDKDRWAMAFQSRLGRKEWLKPYTDETLKNWGAEGVGRVHAICPGFSADCLETIEEIGEENRDYFLEAGGTEYRYIPSLNDRQDHIEALADLVLSNSWR
ncbi:ferrochelatase [Solemya velesiana gill symbiont]|uniref:Ferrochelatase n=1 Tax=Solemya velesiana gill symbiont TaxID=1918948 RepID=A0A1T2KW29_9GAMM|nr:ferrochelatase [Solemya velesiana gill symbiont]OOZ37053.1 ferrochelatase [Solemya velesiana gill symbiont]